MRSVEMARSYLMQAKARLASAKDAATGGNYPFAIRLSQECVELSIKAALRLIGVEYPREHDAGRILPHVVDRFPEWFKDKIPRLTAASRELAKARGPAMYGDEERGIPATELFGQKDADQALGEAEFTHLTVQEFFDWYLSSE